MKVDFELIFINDGSSDNTLSILRDLSKKDKMVRYISFSRNFGKEAGILAGLENSRGKYVCQMDVDLQDPPSLLISMYDEIKKGEYVGFTKDDKLYLSFTKNNKVLDYKEFIK